MISYRAIGILGLVFAGCVSTGTYNQKVAELEKQRSDDAQAAAERIQALQNELAETTSRLKQMTADGEGTQKKLDEMTALADTLKKRLEKLGQNVEKLTGEKGQLSKALEDASDRLAELRKQEAAVAGEAALFRTLVERFRSMIDAGKLNVTIREGRMQLVLPNDVLFDSGRTDIKKDGREALAQVAKILATIPDRRFEVTGHTDNVPIRTARFPSNWELSTARAVEVVNFLIANGMRPEGLSAAGYGEFDPVAANDTPEHRALNRRIEIVVQPNLSEFPSLKTPQASSH